MEVVTILNEVMTLNQHQRNVANCSSRSDHCGSGFPFVSGPSQMMQTPIK